MISCGRIVLSTKHRPVSPTGSVPKPALSPRVPNQLTNLGIRHFGCRHEVEVQDFIRVQLERTKNSKHLHSPQSSSSQLSRCSPSRPGEGRGRTSCSRVMSDASEARIESMSEMSKSRSSSGGIGGSVGWAAAAAGADADAGLGGGGAGSDGGGGAGASSAGGGGGGEAGVSGGGGDGMAVLCCVVLMSVRVRVVSCDGS